MYTRVLSSICHGANTERTWIGMCQEVYRVRNLRTIHRGNTMMQRICKYLMC